MTDIDPGMKEHTHSSFKDDVHVSTSEMLLRLKIPENTRQLSRHHIADIVQHFSFSLECLMDMEAAVPVLEGWMDKWKASESYMFLRLVDEFSCLKSPKNRYFKAKDIIDYFVRANSKYELNIACESRESVLNYWEKHVQGRESEIGYADLCHRGLFDKLSSQVLHMIKTDVFDRFIQSRDFIILLAKLVQRQGVTSVLESLGAVSKTIRMPGTNMDNSSVSTLSESPPENNVSSFLGSLDSMEHDADGDDDTDDISITTDDTYSIESISDSAFKLRDLQLHIESVKPSSHAGHPSHHWTRPSPRPLSKDSIARIIKTYVKPHESCQELRITPFYFKRGLIIISPRHESFLLASPSVKDAEKVCINI